MPNGLLVPAQVANKTQTLLDHVLFALKHEGVNMQVLAQAMAKLPAQDRGCAEFCLIGTGAARWKPITKPWLGTHLSHEQATERLIHRF